VRVTDEMVERAFAVSLGGRVLIRNILEAALADEPEPPPGYAMGAMAREMRIAELEAQLARVRGQRGDLRSPAIGNCGVCGAMVPAVPTTQRWWRYCRDCGTDFGEPAAELRERVGGT